MACRANRTVCRSILKEAGWRSRNEDESARLGRTQSESDVAGSMLDWQATQQWSTLPPVGAEGRRVDSTSAVFYNRYNREKIRPSWTAEAARQTAASHLKCCCCTNSERARSSYSFFSSFFLLHHGRHVHYDPESGSAWTLATCPSKTVLLACVDPATKWFLLPTFPPLHPFSPPAFQCLCSSIKSLAVDPSTRHRGYAAMSGRNLPVVAAATAGSSAAVALQSPQRCTRCHQSLRLGQLHGRSGGQFFFRSY